MTVTDIGSKPRKGRTTVPAVATPATSPALGELTGADGPRTVAIAIELLNPHPSNPRKELGDLTELAESISAHGVRQNLLVVPDPEDAAAFRIVIGHRRTAAARIAGLTTLPAILDTSLTPVAQLELMLLENLQRTDLTAVEEADGYQGLLDLGLDEAAIAKNIGRSRATVASRLRLRTLPEKARAAVAAHQATLGDAELLATTLARPDVAAQKGLAERLTEQLGSNRFVHEVEYVVRGLELDAAKAAARTELEAAGVTVVEAGEYGRDPKNTQKLSYLSDEKGYAGKPLTLARHAKCPGHVAWFGSYDADPIYGCQNWKTNGHHDRYSSSTTSAGSDLTKEDRREIVTNNKAAVAAEAVRRNWIRNSLLSRTKMPADAALYVGRILTVGREVGYKEREVHRQLVADPVTLPPTPTTVDEAMRSLVAHAAAQVETRMEKDFWRKSDERRGAFAHHLSTLASWGYVLSDVEQLVVDAATSAKA